jgi:alkylation response protein AidB-like acyl-CoA dehydrogenase
MPGDGWRIAKATLAIERGAAMLGLQVGFRRELTDLAQLARRTGAGRDPLIRDRLARAWIGLQVIRVYALGTLDGNDEYRASILKVLWSRWHRGGRRRGPGRRVGRVRPLAAALPVQPGRHDLRRLGRDPARHHRQPRPRPPPLMKGSR